MPGGRGDCHIRPSFCGTGSFAPGISRGAPEGPDHRRRVSSAKRRRVLVPQTLPVALPVAVVVIVSGLLDVFGVHDLRRLPGVKTRQMAFARCPSREVTRCEVPLAGASTADMARARNIQMVLVFTRVSFVVSLVFSLL